MGVFRRTFRAFLLVFGSFRFLRHHHLLHFLVLPGLLGLVLGSLLALCIFFGAGILLTHVAEMLVDSTAWLKPFLWLLAIVPAVLFYAASWRLVVALAVLPCLGPLQNRLEQIILGRTWDTRPADDIRNAARGGLKSLVQMAGFPFLALASVPLGPLSAIPLTLYDAYFLGAGIFDAMLEGEFPEPGHRERAMHNLKPEVLGVGLASLLLFLVPLLGIFTSASAGLVAAFRLRYEESRGRES